MNIDEITCHCGQCEGIRGGEREWRESIRFDPGTGLGWTVALLIVGGLFGLLVALMLEVAP